MIDSHTHSSYSKHAKGSIDQVVEAAINRGIKIITITDHAPFPIDSSNRLERKELDRYFTDIDKAADKYKDAIRVLSGLEFDYLPCTENITGSILNQYPLDFAIGSVHYCEVRKNEFIPTYALSHLNNDQYLDIYFRNLKALIESRLFDAIGHPDSVLRGCHESKYEKRMYPLLDEIVDSGIAYEVNASGLRKHSIDPITKTKKQEQVYPHWKTVETLMIKGGSFTIGSDGHSPFDIGRGLVEVKNKLTDIGLKKINVFIRREKHEIPL